jgi:hypothetical protein
MPCAAPPIRLPGYCKYPHPVGGSATWLISLRRGPRYSLNGALDPAKVNPIAAKYDIHYEVQPGS